jgi:hypothetical protein
MSLRNGVLSLLVLFAICLLVFENYRTWTLPVEVLPEKGVTKKSVQKTESPLTRVGEKEAANLQSYILVSEKNIFSPERKEFAIVLPPSAQVKPPIVRPQIILYGVTMAGDYQFASIVNPGRALKKGERETMSVKAGDQIGEFKVAKILSDRIVMEAAGDSFEVLLYDAKSPKQRTYAKTEAKPATVTSTLPTPATAPSAVPTPVPAPGPTTTVAPAQPPATAAPMGRRLSRSPVLPSGGQQATGPVAPQAVGPVAPQAIGPVPPQATGPVPRP